MRFFVSRDRDQMLDFLRQEGQPFAAVEAEWGSREIGKQDGAVVAYNHHEGRPGVSPSLAYNSQTPDAVQLVALSHLDLDSVLGCMALKGTKPADQQGFYALAAYADVNGVHRIAAAKEPRWEERDVQSLAAFLAWSEANQLAVPADAVTDCTSFVERAEGVLLRILAGDAGLLREGQLFRQRQLELNRTSYQGLVGSVATRRAAAFTNHLYATPDGALAADGVVALDTRTGAVTLSLASPEAHPGVDCAGIARGLWGVEAGGSKGIAGSPRGRAMTEDDLQRAAEALNNALQAAAGPKDRQTAVDAALTSGG